MRQLPPQTNDLSELLRREIAVRGVISFARFMELALYYPGLGYYERSSKQIGCHGDFYTSVSVGSVFGELLAFQFASWLDKMQPSNADPNSGSRFQLVEAGAHDGRLAADVLQWFRQYRPDLEPKMEYWILEPSSIRQREQREILTEFLPCIRWFDSWNNIPSPICGIIFGNELLDAFPMHRLGWDAQQKQWFEWGVTCRADQFVWEKLPRASDASSKPFAWPCLPDALYAVLPDGFITELSPAAETWWRQAARSLRHGKIVAIDYGLTAQEFLAPERLTGTLRSYHRHHPAANPLAYPGEQDLTAHVNFSHLIEAGELEGLITEVFTSQSQFFTRIVEAITENSRVPRYDSCELTDAFSLTPTLSRWERENPRPSLAKAGCLESSNAQPISLPLPAGEGQGEGERVEEQSKPASDRIEKHSHFPVWTPQRLRQFKTLTHPEHLGRAFKVLVQSR